MNRVIIAGSRDINDYALVCEVIEASGFNPAIVVSGGASGVDRLGERWAADNRRDVIRHPADWRKWGKSAGIRRNCEMAEAAEALIAIWDGKSRGTKHMISEARANGLAVYVHRTDGKAWTP